MTILVKLDGFGTSGTGVALYICDRQGSSIGFAPMNTIAEKTVKLPYKYDRGRPGK